MMKKFFCVILCVVLLFNLSIGAIAQTVNQDDNIIDIWDIFTPVEVSLSSAQATPHSEVCLALNVSSNPGFAVMRLTLNYDTDKLTLTDVESSIEVQFTENDGYAVVTFFSLGSDCVDLGELAELTFQVGAVSGDVVIGLSADAGDICDNKAMSLKHFLSGGVITSVCDHLYTYSGTKEANCQEQGEIIYVCNICNSERITYTDKTSHIAKDKWEQILEPDCDTAGINALLCQYCEEVMQSEEIAPLGHKYGEYTVTKEPECEKEGSQYRICAVCNYKEVSAIEATGHDEGTWRTTIPSDCVNSGIASRYCNTCDAVLETKKTEVGEHFMSWVVTVKPTCSSEGTEEYLCVVCGGESEGTRSVSKLDHIHGEEEIVTEPTCSEKGFAQTRCKNCDTVVATREIDTVPHTKGNVTVITAPTDTASGTGEYRCTVCDTVIENVIFEATDAKIYMEDVTAYKGDTVKIPVVIENNTGFSVGIVRIKYDEESMILSGVNAGDVASDVTLGTPAAGQANVLMSLSSEEYENNGILFYVEFTLTEDAADSDVELSYEPQNDFSAENGDRVFVNIYGGKIKTVVKIAEDGSFLAERNVLNRNTYKINIDYVLDTDLTEDVGIGFKTTAEDGVGYPTYIEGENAAIYTIPSGTGSGQHTATALITTDMFAVVTGNDIAGYDDELTVKNSLLYGYIIDAQNVTGIIIKNVSAENLGEVVGVEEALLLTKKAETQIGNQAIRYRFNYKTENGSNIIMGDDNTQYKILSRGFICANGEKYTTDGKYYGNMNLTSAKEGTFVYDSKSENFDVCWAYNEIENTQYINLTFSTYVIGFDSEDERELMVRGFVTVEMDGQVFTVYSDTINRSVQYLKTIY